MIIINPAHLSYEAIISASWHGAVTYGGKLQESPCLNGGSCLPQARAMRHGEPVTLKHR